MSDVRHTIKDFGDSALAALEGVHVNQPLGAEPQLNEAVERLVQLRDELIERQRGGEDCGRWLGRINGMLSGIVSVEYPPGGIQWQRICETRDDLRAMVASLDEGDRR